MAHIKKTNPKLFNHADFRADEPKTLPLSVDAEVLKFIRNPERNQELTLEGLVNTLFESGLHEKRDEIEKTVLHLKDEGYIAQHGDNSFEVTETGDKYLHNGEKKIAKKSKKIAPKAATNIDKNKIPKNKAIHNEKDNK